MVLKTSDFQVRRSLRQAIKRFVADEHCEIRFDTAFQDVIVACAQSPRRQQSGTWILPAMVQAYIQLHQAGHAHSVETWIDDRLVGGLYCVAIGKAVFGESMFTRVSDGSKLRWLRSSPSAAKTVLNLSIASKTPLTWPLWGRRRSRVRHF
jgi:leucyl/phenylalanyl-tRNA--protein transferase